MPEKCLPLKTLNLVTYDRCRETLSELVKIESVNPFDSEGKTEDEIALCLGKKMRKIGLLVEEQTVAKGRFNPVGLLEGKKGGPTIMLNSHMDTVGVEGMKKFSLLEKQEISSWYYLPCWKPSLAPARQPGDVWAPRTWLIFVDATGLGLQLAQQLEEEHWETIIVKAGIEYSQETHCTYTIAPGNADHYKALFKEFNQLDKCPQQVVHLWGVTGGNREMPRDEWVERCQELGYYSLIFLTQAIEVQNLDKEIHITVVTDNMQGIYEKDLLHPGKATLLGPVNIIPREYLNIKCRTIDIDGPGTGNRQKQKVIRQLLEEIKASSTDTVVVYRGNRRFLPAYEPIRLERPAGTNPRFREKGVYLITGGLGDIGLLQAKYLASLVKARLILTGRSAFPPWHQWEQWLSTHPGNEPTCIKIKELQEIEKLGGELLVCRADVSHREQMEEIVQAAEKEWGPINGIIHNALQIDDGMIHSITREKTGNVFASKVKGTLVLDEIFKNHPLDFFVLSSSIDSIIMEIGHVAFGAASAFLDAFSQQKANSDDSTVISINWSTWQELAGAAALAPEHGKVPGLSAAQSEIKNRIRSEEGMEAFSRIMGVDPLLPRVVVSSQDLNERIKLSKTLNARDTQEPVAKAVLSKKRIPRPGLDSDYVPARNDMERKLVEIWCEFFGFEKIGTRDDFFELGGDSLKAMTIISKICKESGIEVPIGEFFNRPTINKLCEYMMAHVGSSTYDKLEPVEKREYYLLSSTQKRVYILQQMEPASTAFNISLIVNLQGKPMVAKFEKAFERLTERHEGFRTSFQLHEDNPVQKISRKIPFSIKHYEVKNRENSDNKTLSPNEAMHMTEISSLVNNFIQSFDLTRVPLLRVGLVKLTETYHILMVDTHHIISDGVSQGILIGDILNLYKGEEVSPLKLQYRDFSAWQNTLLHSEKMKIQERYWLDRFKGEIPLLKIPTDYPRETWQNFEGEGLVFDIDEELTKEFKTITTKYGTTLYMTLLAVFSILLSKYTDQADIIIGSPTAGRRHADLDNVVGMFVNVLLMRSYPAPAKTFAGFLQEIKTITLKAFENQDYQFDDLVERLKLNRDTEKNPIYNVVFAVMNLDYTGDQLPGLNVEPYAIEKMTAKTELRLGAVETANTISMKLTYVKSLFKKEHVVEMAQHYIDILKQVLKNNEIKLKDIKISHRMTTLKPSPLRSDPDEFNF